MKFIFENKIKNIIWIIKCLKSIHFRKPPTKKILIFDKQTGTEALDRLFNSKDCHLVDIRLRSINIYVLMVCLFKNRTHGIYLKYLIEYVQCVKPRVCFIMQENNKIFYKIKEYYSNTYFIVAQIAVVYGDDWRQYYSKEEKYKCDYFIASSQESISFFKNYIDSNYLKYGLVRSNIYLVNLPKDKNDIGYISEYREGLSKAHYETELEVVKRIGEYCKKHSHRLKIGLASNRKDKLISPEKEESYFKRVLDEFETSQQGSYEYLKGTKIIICVISNLGLELISRGLKVFFLDIRHFAMDNLRKNYFSLHYGDSGEFWDTGKDWDIVFEKISNVINLDDEGWKRVIRKYRMPVEYFDPDNKKLKNLVNNILVKNGNSSDCSNKKVL